LPDKTVEVAAAVVQRADGSFLLAQRPPGKVYAGYWEFPGGKIEPGESPAQALVRELHEELGLSATCIYPWLTRNYIYPHAKVKLHFQRVVRWQGEPRSREGQAFAWQFAGKPDVAPMLPANTAVLKALELPAQYAITNATELGEQEALRRLESALNRGLKLVQVREKQFDKRRLENFAHEVVTQCRRHGAKVMINGELTVANNVAADGVHLTATQLLETRRRPEVQWCAASCHDAVEIRKSESLGLDFIVVGPVKATPSHPGARPLGWRGLHDLMIDAALPVYALGGVQRDDLEQAWEQGAHGIAMLRGAWQA